MGDDASQQVPASPEDEDVWRCPCPACGGIAERMSSRRIAERVLKLSLPVLYVWLCGFYCFFHLWLNIVAEVLRYISHARLLHGLMA